MRTVLVVVAVAAISLCLTSCGSPEPDMTALKKTVDEYNAASKEAMMTGNSEKSLAFFEDDGLEMGPNMPAVKGKEAIRVEEQQMMKSGMKFKSVDFTVTDLQAGGKIAYEIGTYDMTISVPKAGDVKDKGKYIALWHQQADGVWKLRAETWNTDMPLPVVEKPKAKKVDTKHKIVAKKNTSSKKAVTKKTSSKKKTTKKSNSTK